MKVRLYQCGDEHDKGECTIPLGLGYLISNAPKGHDIQAVKDPSQLVDCDLIGLSSAAWGLREAVSILKSHPNTPVIIGGQGALWPGLAVYPFKHIIIGEGEFAFNRILAGETLPKTIHCHNIKDLDTLNPPERGTLRRGILPMVTSRGCPFHCKFCSAYEQWGLPRFHSAEFVIGEIFAGLARYGPQCMNDIYILDDLFIAHRPRLERIHELWLNHNLNSKLKSRRLPSFVRADLFDEDTGRMLLDMGFPEIRFGAESGSDRILQLLGKRVTVERYEQTIDTCRRLGIKVSASFMHNIPGETPEDEQLTQDFIKRTGIKICGNYQYKSFPGTAMWDGSSPLDIDMRVRQ